MTMLNAIVQSPSILAAAIIAMALLNYWIGVAVLRAESRQPFFKRRDSVPAIESRSKVSQLAVPFVTAAPVAALVFFLDHVSREALGGGYLVMQLAALIGNIDGLMRVRVLLVPRVAEGRVVLSTEYQYWNAAARMVTFGLFTAIVAILFTSLAFAAGGAFLLATGLGWYRRARQASSGFHTDKG